MILMYFDAQTDTWHIAKVVQKSGLGIAITTYCEDDGGNQIYQLPREALDKLKVCEQCGMNLAEMMGEENDTRRSAKSA